MIQKLEWRLPNGEFRFLADEPLTLLSEKIDEVIDSLNDLLEAHPKLGERLEMKRTFEEHMTSDTPKDSFRANND
jgi:hypothetical protein